MALFGIKRIQYCKATQLAFSGQNNPFLGIASEPTNTFTDVVCMINSRATLTIEQAVVNKQIVYTAKLQFVTPADPMLDVDHYAFIATTNEGERILLGANTRPQVAVVTAQGVFGTSGELTAYTTTAEFKADYRPMRLPVNSEAIEDLRVFDICCGQITGTETPDTLTVVWQNYDGTELDRKTYYSNQPEPTTTVVPTKPSTAQYSYTFSSWELYSNQNNTKIYRPIFTQTAVIYTVRWINYDNTTVAEENYTYGQPEPTTQIVPTRPTDAEYSYEFKEWVLYSETTLVKTYKATYDSFPAVEPSTIWIPYTTNTTGNLKTLYNIQDSTTETAEGTMPVISTQGESINGGFVLAKCYYKLINTTVRVLTTDWREFMHFHPEYHPIYNGNIQVGVYTDAWQGEI